MLSEALSASEGETSLIREVAILRCGCGLAQDDTR